MPRQVITGGQAQIRQTQIHEVSLLPGIERSAAQEFRSVPGLEWIADGSVTSEDEHACLIRSGLHLVAVDEDDRPVGFICARELDNALHILEFSIAHRHQKRGIGRALIIRLLEEAHRRGFGAATLTTFRDIAWNAPFYKTVGFRELAPQALTPGLALLLRDEAARGLPGDRRCTMRLDFSAATGLLS